MGNGFFSWFHFSNFIDTYQEWHALVEGFSEGFCIVRKSRYEPYDQEEENLLKDLRTEHHYYAAGRVLGLATFIVLATGMIVWIIGAIR
jgi:hypothetical protein